ncbi:rRNA-processing protein utp21 [Dipsacomyces acuminosporus]|nr:rRNA-processing protein utp21 [Dipsacomyces acuminosporus]
MAPATKKTRKESALSKKQPGSRLFEPYRALGYIASSIPHSIQYRGQSLFVTAGIGRSYHIYDGEKLNLLFVGPRFDQDIDSILSIGDDTFVSTGGKVIVCQRGKSVGELESVERGDINNLMQFGDYIMAISDDNTLVIWDKNTRELFTEIEFERESFLITAVVHPSTYVNKVVVGSAQGTMQVWNIQTRRCLYQFKSFGAGIACMAQAPVIDVIALGLLDGRILLHNVKLDRSVMQLSQEGRVTSVSFRTDEVPMMASSNSEGDIALWDLNNKRLIHVMQAAHDGTIPAIDFIAGQPLLLTSSADNSIKEWLFDGQDGVPRLLRHRSGHFAAPQMIRYHGEDGRSILSSGRDRSLRFFSVTRDSQNVEMSQGSLAREARTKKVKMSDLRFPPITSFASNPAKTKDWDDVLTCHQGSVNVQTWSVDRKALGKYTVESPDGSLVRAVAISACGNFGFLGLASGSIEMVNIQSGLSRRTFTGHTKAVTGIESDACNGHVYSTSLDGTLRVWDFASGAEVHCLSLPSAPSRLVFHRESGLLACICDDGSVRIVDSESYRTVRKFAGHKNRITDVAFSNDGRWIVTSSLDSTIRTWDLPTGHMVDWFRVESVPVSVAFSPTGDFLATAHMDSVGIFLWANRTQFADVTLRQINPNEDEEPASAAALVAMPTSAGLSNGTEEEDQEGGEAGDEQKSKGSSGVYLAPEQLTENMITLSSLAKSKWQTLLSLATIKKRNMPERAPKAPEQAPFFLPSLEGVEHRFDIDAQPKDSAKESDEPVERTGISTASAQSGLARALYHAQETLDYRPVFDYLKQLNPSAVDLEIRTLPMDDSLRAIKSFVQAMASQLRSKRDFELVQAYVKVFLDVFADIVKANADDLGPLLAELRRECKSQWSTVDGLIRYSACMVEFMRTSK